MCVAVRRSPAALVLAVRMWENKSRNCLENDRQCLSPTGVFSLWMEIDWQAVQDTEGHCEAYFPSCLSYSLSLKLKSFEKLQKKMKKKSTKMYQVTMVFSTITKIIQLLWQLKNQTIQCKKLWEYSFLHIFVYLYMVFLWKLWVAKVYGFFFCCTGNTHTSLADSDGPVEINTYILIMPHVPFDHYIHTE